MILYFFVFISFGSEFPAGPSTTSDWSRNAFSHPIGEASRMERRFFGVGNSFFKQAWVATPSSTLGRDGLGPTFNAVSCSSCHSHDGRGSGVNADGKLNVSMLFRLSLKKGLDFVEHPDYGSQIQPNGILGVPGEAKISVQYSNVNGQYADGTHYELRRPKYIVESASFAPIGPETVLSPRVGPQMVGLGLLEAIDAQSILAHEDPNDSNSDGISGRANWVRDIESGRQEIGRFGWKAGQPTIKQQNAAAFMGDMGLTSELFPSNNCPSVQIDCQRAPEDPELEVSEKVLRRVTQYVQMLTVPRVRNFNAPDFAAGQKLFHQVQCASCHQPSFVTGDHHEIEALRGLTIWPYTDMLLHDLGEGLADHRPEAEASGREWRTSPLWGIGLIPTVNGHSNLLHDGRARNVEEAILWHGGEAEAARDAFKQLSLREREQLIFFVNSL